MSDAPKEAKKDEKKEEKKDDKAGAAAKKPGMAGPIGAVVAILAAGIGIGFYMSSLVKPKAPEPKAEAGAEGAGAEGAHGTGEAKGAEDAHGAAGAAKGASHGSVLHTSTEFSLGDIMSNVRGQQGRRFAKMTCVLWLDVKVAKLALGGGGGHGGGGEPGENVKRILQAAFEEHLKTYDLDDLTGINIYKLLEKSFKDISERELRQLYDAKDLPTDKPLVNKVVLTNLLVQ